MVSTIIDAVMLMSAITRIGTEERANMVMDAHAVAVTLDEELLAIVNKAGGGGLLAGSILQAKFPTLTGFDHIE